MPAASSCRSPRFLDDAPDVVAFAKNYLAVGFKLDYVKADGDLSNYTPDFIVRTTDGAVWIVETKGREETRRAAEDGAASPMVRGRDGRQRDPKTGPSYRFVYVDQKGFEQHPPKTMAGARRELHGVSDR